jgi:hypothetical protein
MSIESLLDALRKNADSISKRIYEKRRSLASPTGIDGYTKSLMEFAHLEGVLKGIEISMSKIKKHIGTDINVGTKLPTSAKRSEDELPAWCKVGQWVMDNDTMLWKITGFDKDLINTISAHNTLGFKCHWRDVKPVKFRPYTYDEAENLVGKVMEYERSRMNGTVYARVLVYMVEFYDGYVWINGITQDNFTHNNATINGAPIGVPEIDKEAMKEVEE